MTDLRYPIGPRPALPAEARTPETLATWAVALQKSVAEWQTLAATCTPEDLARTYRPESWTVSQLIHHVPEAHLFGLVRLKLGLSQENYVIQPMDEQKLMAQPDKKLPVAAAVAQLAALNEVWVALLLGVDLTEWSREILHPEEGKQDLWQLAAKHEWHLRRHLAHARLATMQQVDVI